MNVLTFLPASAEVQSQLAMIIRSQGYPLQNCSSEEEVFQRATELGSTPGHRVLLFTEYGCLDLVRHLSDAKVPVSVVVLIKERLQKIACELLNCLSVQSFVAHQIEDFEPREFVTMLRKVADPNIAGLEKYLGFGATIEERMVRTPEEKAQSIVAVANFVARIGGESEQKRFGEYARRVSELVDELVLNALFDANPSLQDFNRSGDFELSAQESVHVRWGFDGDIFGVSVRDPFGNLKKETVLHYLDDTARDMSRIHERKSAGLGIRLVFERMHQFIVNIKPGQMTEVICLLHFEKRFRDFETKLKSFHYYTI